MTYLLLYSELGAKIADSSVSARVLFFHNLLFFWKIYFLPKKFPKKNTCRVEQSKFVEKNWNLTFFETIDFPNKIIFWRNICDFWVGLTCVRNGDLGWFDLWRCWFFANDRIISARKREDPIPLQSHLTADFNLPSYHHNSRVIHVNLSCIAFQGCPRGSWWFPRLYQAVSSGTSTLTGNIHKFSYPPHVIRFSSPCWPLRPRPSDSILTSKCIMLVKNDYFLRIFWIFNSDLYLWKLKKNHKYFFKK